ncbi:hypothetical protein D3C87_2074010 [compost metagenome]
MNVYMVNNTMYRKAPDAVKQSEAGRLGVGITLSVKDFRRDYGVLQLSSNDDGKPSRV